MIRDNVIEEIRKQDLDQLQKIMKQAFNSNTSESKTQDFYETSKNNKDIYVLGYYIKNILVGTVTLNILPTPSRKQATIWNLAVLEEYRTLGIATKLMIKAEEIVDRISNMHELIRAGMHLTALSKGNEELADKIDKANELIKFKRIDEFKKSVANGTHEEFLANISWTDKTSLKVDMELSRFGLPNEKDLTEEEQKYYDIIENSIKKDVEKEALSRGFDSVEAWRNHNAMCTGSVILLLH